MPTGTRGAASRWPLPLFDPEHLIRALAPFHPAPRVWIAYSGGLDSTCLLHAAASVRERLPGPLAAAHLDHGLHPQSGRWAEGCRAVCEVLSVPLTNRCLTVGRAPGESLEARARQARYAALGALLGPGELMLTAQHQDDQAETLLLALLRGSGPDGLAAMPAVSDLGSGRLVRPLLDVPRAALEAYARERVLSWVEDPSNDSLAFDRNFLRRRVLPLLRERWPAASASLARSAAHCAEAATLIEGRAAETLAGLTGVRRGTLSVSALSRLDPPHSKVVLRLWLRRLGLPPPPSAHLGRILTEVLPARPDGKPLVAWPGCEIRRYRDDLFALVPLPPRPRDDALVWKGWCLRLPSPLGTLTRAGTERPSAVFGTDAVAQPLQVRFGVEGRWCRSGPRGHRRPLKKIFQDAAIPSWLRPYVPLVFAGEELLAVAGIGPCHAEPAWVVDPARLRWSGHPWEGLGVFCEDAAI